MDTRSQNRLRRKRFSGNQLRAAYIAAQEKNKIGANAEYRKEEDDYDEVYPNIWISSRHFAKSIPTLAKVGITHVLNCAEGRGFGIDKYITGPEFYENSGVLYKGINAVDSIAYDLSKHFEECLVFMADALKQNGRILVHCQQGKSRSVTIVAAYLIKYSGMSAMEALVHIASKREIYPNSNFINLLSLYDMKKYVKHEE